MMESCCRAGGAPLNMDDEGTPTGRTVLIEARILRGYITDKLNALPDGHPRDRQWAARKLPKCGAAKNDEYVHVSGSLRP